MAGNLQQLLALRATAPFCQDMSLGQIAEQLSVLGAGGHDNIDVMTMDEAMCTIRVVLGDSYITMENEEKRDFVYDLKEKLQNNAGVDASRIILSHAGQPLDDLLKLGEVNGLVLDLTVAEDDNEGMDCDFEPHFPDRIGE